jgi:hypothetical protein
MSLYVGVPRRLTGDGSNAVTVFDYPSDDGKTFGEQSHPLELHTHGDGWLHSPDGHAWGYNGSGPAQLALDILWNHTGTEPTPATYQAFKRDVIARLGQEQSWMLTTADVAAWLEANP